MNPENTTAKIFRSRRDTWLVMLLLASVLVMAFAVFQSFSEQASSILAFSVLGVCTCAAIFILWIIFSTKYEIRDRVLSIEAGPFRFQLPLTEIVAVVASSDLRASPALSRQRLQIRWGKDEKKIWISPERQAEFLASLAASCPQLQSTSDGLILAREA